MQVWEMVFSWNKGPFFRFQPLVFGGVDLKKDAFCRGHEELPKPSNELGVNHSKNYYRFTPLKTNVTTENHNF